MDDVNVDYFCDKSVPDEEDGESGSWRMQPGSGKGELRVRRG